MLMKEETFRSKAAALSPTCRGTDFFYGHEITHDFMLSSMKRPCYMGLSGFPPDSQPSPGSYYKRVSLKEVYFLSSPHILKRPAL